MNYWQISLGLLLDFQKWLEEEAAKFEVSETDIQAYIKEVLING